MNFRDLLGFELGLPVQEKITRAKVQVAHKTSPRRICFPVTHRNALKRDKSGKYVGSISVPFFDTICPIFRAQTNLELFRSKGEYGGCWRSIRDEQEYDQIKRWIGQQGYRVFLRDCLALSIALGPNFDENGQRTSLGRLEYDAKWATSQEAVEELSEMIGQSISGLPFYDKAEICAAVPPRKEKKFDLPSTLAAKLAAERKLTDVTSAMAWDNAKPKVKDLDYEARWQALEDAGLTVSTNVKGKNIILLDDLYQSGVTIQFVGMRLLNAGAKRIYGLSLVKSRRDTDNR